MTTKVRLIGIRTERWQKKPLLLPRGRGYVASLRSPGLLSAYVVGPMRWVNPVLAPGYSRTKWEDATRAAMDEAVGGELGADFNV